MGLIHFCCTWCKVQRAVGSLKALQICFSFQRNLTVSDAQWRTTWFSVHQKGLKNHNVHAYVGVGSCGGKMKPAPNHQSGLRWRRNINSPQNHKCHKCFCSCVTSSWLLSMWWATECCSVQTDSMPPTSESGFCPALNRQRSVFSSHHRQDTDVWCFRGAEPQTVGFQKRPVCPMWLDYRLHFKAYGKYLDDRCQNKRKVTPGRRILHTCWTCQTGRHMTGKIMWLYWKPHTWVSMSEQKKTKRTPEYHHLCLCKRKRSFMCVRIRIDVA